MTLVRDDGQEYRGKRLTREQVDIVERRLSEALDRWSGVGHTVEAARLHVEAEFLQTLVEELSQDGQETEASLCQDVGSTAEQIAALEGQLAMAKGYLRGIGLPEATIDLILSGGVTPAAVGQVKDQIDRLEDQTESLRVELTRSPRGRAKLTLQRVLEGWGVGGFDNDGMNEPAPSERVMARQLIDALDEDDQLLRVYTAGFKRGLAKMSSAGDQTLAVSREDLRRMFERYWLDR
jgi:hypothetical protein